MSATRLHAATPEDRTEKSEGVRSPADTENPQYFSDKSEMRSNALDVSVESSLVSVDWYVVAKYDTGSG